MTAGITRDADRRLAAIHRDLASAGPFYLRQQVVDALRYWRLPIPEASAAEELAA